MKQADAKPGTVDPPETESNASRMLISQLFLTNAVRLSAALGPGDYPDCGAAGGTLPVVPNLKTGRPDMSRRFLGILGYSWHAEAISSPRQTQHLTVVRHAPEAVVLWGQIRDLRICSTRHGRHG